ncbi:hypothetical protein PV375_05630 [Gulosibacter sp. GYB002]|uniref:hypothetical protein n=1 Tax=Gulosibacter sp. GYB002 TaxID=2994391 RepID=UPI002F9639B0
MAYEYVIEPSARGSGTWGLNFKWSEPGQRLCALVQFHLRRLGRYSGPIDGAWGPNTIKGIQKSIAAGNYYSGPIDGAVGKNTVIGVIRYAYQGAEDAGQWVDAQWIDRHASPSYPAMGTDPGKVWKYFEYKLSKV